MMLRQNFFDEFYLIFRQTPQTEEILKNANEKNEKEEADNEYPRIRCPHCHWKPSKTSRWYCADAPENLYQGCFTCWNTFDTRGVCPGCSHRWRYTSCLACHRYSPHEDWYV